MQTQRLLTVATLLVFCALVPAGLLLPALTGGSDTPPELVPPEEYLVYDLVVRSKFLTSQTSLVIIDRMTVANHDEDERPYLTHEFFEEQEVFEGRLPPALASDFFFKLRRPSRLEAKFSFGVRYRFLLDGVPEEPEVFLAPIPVGGPFTDLAPSQTQSARPTVGTLRFSRVGFTPREDQALVYVEEERPDGTGGGMLIWLHRRNTTWTITDTELLWIAQLEEPGLESP